jgi:chromosome segregation ATPase
MLDSVAKLEAAVTAHADQLETLAHHAMRTSAEVTALAVQVRDVSKRMDDVSKRMDDVSNRMDGVAQRLGSLEGETQSLAEGFVESAGLARSTQQQVGRFARLLTEYAGRSDSRFDEIEGRLDALEKKAS